MCPRCGVPMATREVEVLGPNVLVDVCPGCRGMWFDDGELRRVLRDRKVGDRLALATVGREASALACPRCGESMDLKRAEDVEIDACPNCRGLWLDMGELGSMETFARAGSPTERGSEGRTIWNEEPFRRREMSFYRFLRDFTRR